MDQHENKRIQHPGRSRRRILRVLKVLILVYCSVGIALYYLQEKFLFHPEPLDIDHRWNFEMPFEEINLPYTSKENLNIVRFLPKDTPARGAVIYFHGNMKNIGRYAKLAQLFTSRGLEVWMPDYPGFGKTTGELTERKLYDQAAQVYKLVRQRHGTDSIIIYGKSLGTGIATQLASQIDCRSLVLETPYYSIPDLFSAYAPVYPTSRMSNFKIPLAQFLVDCKMPVTIFHGTDDGVIPYRAAKKLMKLLKSSDQFVTIEEAEHNDIPEYPVYRLTMDRLLKF
jgi:uncharacterized protein